MGQGNCCIYYKCYLILSVAKHFIVIIIIIIIIIIICIIVSCHRPFLPGTSLEPAVIPTTQSSSFILQYFPIMCDVPSTAVFCSESIKYFPGISTKFFLKLLVTIAVAPIITGILLLLLLLLLF